MAGRGRDFRTPNVGSSDPFELLVGWGSSPATDGHGVRASHPSSFLLFHRILRMKSWLTKHRTVFPIVLLAGCLLWSFWPSLAAMSDRWAIDPRYAHGYFVPMFSLALLWMRRARLDGLKPGKSTWGLAFMGLGAAIQLGGGYFRIGTLEGLALLPYLSGIALLLGGWPILKWAWPSIAFLAFMIPLPWRVENALGPPLQYDGDDGEHVSFANPRFHGLR